MRKTFVLALLVTGCTASPAVMATSTDPVTVPGDSQTFYGAKVTSWAKTVGGTVTEVGITLPVAGVDATPTDPKAKLPEPATLTFPDPVKQQTIFDHLELEYTAAGHPPTPYQVPHLDMHYFGLDQKGLDAIDCLDKTPPAPNRLPPGYDLVPLPNGLCEAGEGTAAWNMGVPELRLSHPDKFTERLIYGFYKGAMAYVAPMVARDVLESKANFDLDVPLPPELGRGALFPTHFKGTFDTTTQAYQLVWTDFVPLK